MRRLMITEVIGSGYEFDDSIDDIIEMLNRIKTDFQDKYSNLHICKVYATNEYECDTYELMGARPETDKEYQKRTEKSRKIKSQVNAEKLAAKEKHAAYILAEAKKLNII